MLQALSYNIEHGKNLEQAGEWIMSLKPKPDLLCLQEIPQNKAIAFFPAQWDPKLGIHVT